MTILGFAILAYRIGRFIDRLVSGSRAGRKKARRLAAARSWRRLLRRGRRGGFSLAVVAAIFREEQQREIRKHYRRRTGRLLSSPEPIVTAPAPFVVKVRSNFPRTRRWNADAQYAFILNKNFDEFIPRANRRAARRVRALFGKQFRRLSLQFDRGQRSRT